MNSTTPITRQWSTRKFRALYRHLRSTYFGDYLPPASKVAIRWNGRLTASAGRCFVRNGQSTIELSPHYHERHRDEVASTILHEMIHLVVPGHGPEFTKWMARIQEQGGTVRRHAQERATRPTYRYVVRCSSCGAEGRRYQRWSKTLTGIVRSPIRWQCAKCKTVGSLQVVEYR